MKNRIKLVFKKIIGEKNKRKIKRIKSYLSNYISLVKNTYKDGALFYEHSMTFRLNTFNKIESKIILYYHSLEKGFLHENFKFRFGKNNVIELIDILKLQEVINNYKTSQIAAAYLAICKYYEIHKTNNVDISDFFKEEDYYYFKNLQTLDIDVVKTHNRNDFFNKSESNFHEFSESRMSIRSFTGIKIPLKIIEKAIEIAKTAPSVCNRQPVKVYYLENKKKIDKVLDIQKGLRGFSDEITQLLILVSDRNYFHTVGERNQLYIDGGIFLMNLLYALHYYKIGACPAHWGFNTKQDKKIQKELQLNDSEKVICLITIGIPKNEFNTTLSLRRANDEVLKVYLEKND